MRLLLCASGTTGDVHPLIGIAEAMRRRGHEVILLANPAYEKLAHETAVGFEPIGTVEHLAATKNHPHAWSYKHGWKHWIREAGLTPMPELYAAIERLHQPGSTVLAASYLCMGSRVAQEKLQIPAATLHLNVHTVRSIHGIYAYPPPPFLPESTPVGYLLPQWTPQVYRNTLLWLADLLFINPTFRTGVNRFRREVGLPRLQQFVREWWSSPDLAIGMFPDWWGGAHADWPLQMVTTGFPLWDRTESQEMSTELQQFVGDDKVLIFSPGASSGHTDTHFAAYSQTCRRLEKKGIVLTPRADTIASTDPCIRFERYVPFRQLLAHAAAVVHHAGIGTSAHCLKAGIPQVVVPTLYNQPDTAIRLEKLGVGRQIRAHRFNERRLHAALQEVLDSPQVAENCRTYAEKFVGRDATEEICGHLESLL